MIAEQLNSRVDGLKTAILGDTSYSSCCVDEVAAQHINGDAIIHFGHACHYLSSTIPVFYVYLKQDIDIDHMVSQFKTELPDTSTKVLMFYDVTVKYLICK